MKTFLQQTPVFVAGIVWIFLLNLLQPLFASRGILVYADTVFLFIPALFMTPRAAFLTVIACTFFADATRASPFGLSATLMLPALLVLMTAQRDLRRWPRGMWIVIAVVVNTLAWLIAAWIFSQTATQPPSVKTALAATVAGASASALLIVVFGNWFWSFQLALSAVAGKDLLARVQKNGE